MRRLLLTTALLAAPAGARAFTLSVPETPAPPAMRSDLGPRATACWADHAARRSGVLVHAPAMTGM